MRGLQLQASPAELQARLDRGEKVHAVQEMSPEYYDALLNLMLMQADSELAGGVGYMPRIARAPGIQEMYVVSNMDRGAGHQLYDAEHCSYAPWNRAIVRIGLEEAGQLQHGDMWVQRLAEDPATRPEVQDALDRWYPRVMNIFGRPNTPKNQLYRRLGLKVRDNHDVRQAFVADISPKLAAWDLTLPDWTAPWGDAERQHVYVAARDEARAVPG